MATYYVASTGDNSDGTTWAKAYTTLAGAFTAQSAAGHTYVVDAALAESGASLTLTCPGTAASPSMVLGATNTGSAVVAADLIDAKGGASGPTFTSTTNTSLSLAGIALWQGCRFHAGQAGSATSNLLMTGTGVVRFKNCHFAIKADTSAGVIRGGGTGTHKTVLDNCSVEFTAATQSISCNGGSFEYFNTPTAFSGSDPTNGFISPNAIGDILIDGVDLSAINTSSTEYVGAITSATKVTLRNCKLDATPTLKSNTPTNPGCVITFENCHSSGNYVHERWMYQGKQEIETTIIRTGGASDGTQGIAWKITPTANNEIIAPFECIPIVLWNDVEDVSRTVTVEGVWSGGAVPTNNDIWMEVSYLANASDPGGLRVTTAPLTPLTSATNQASSSETWGGSTTKFKMTAPFTPLQKGPVMVWIKVAKASETFYICPLVSIANT
jgi:hypothetical protein